MNARHRQSRSRIFSGHPVLFLGACVLACAGVARAQPAPELTRFHKHVEARTGLGPETGGVTKLAFGGAYDTPRTGDGFVTDMPNFLYDGRTVLSAERSGGSYCAGLTLQLFVEAYSAAKAGAADPAPADPMAGKWLNGLSFDQVVDFQRAWYANDRAIRTDPALKQRARRRAAVAALVDLAKIAREVDLGAPMDLTKLAPGDFLQVWFYKQDGARAGHSAIFEKVEEVTPATTPKTFRVWYWSSQVYNAPDPADRNKPLVKAPGIGLSYRDIVPGAPLHTEPDGDEKEFRVPPGHITQLYAARVEQIK